MTNARPHIRRWLTAAGVSLGTALLVAGVFFLLGNPWNGDITFHASSWLDVSGQWKEGVIYPRWMEWANFGFGEPRFVFYPPLSWILGAALTLLFPWQVVPSIFVVVIQTLAGLCMYALSRRFFSETGALLATAFFAANPYALLNIYHRGALAEQLAWALIPLVILGSLELSGLVNAQGRSLLCSIPLFTLAFSAVWLSDVPVAIITTYTVVLIFACVGLQKKSLEPLWRGAAGVALGFGLNSFHLLPVLYEQKWASVGLVLPTKESLANNFLFYLPPPYLFTSQNISIHSLHKIASDSLPFSWIASDVAVLLLVATMCGSIVVYRRAIRERQGGESRRMWVLFVFLSAMATFLMIRGSWYVWKYLPKFLLIQFPWRWMGVISVPYAVLLAGSFEGRRHARWAWGTAVFVMVGAISTVLVLQGGRFKRNLAALKEAIADDRGFEGTAEYYAAEGDRQAFGSHYFSFLEENVPRVQFRPDKNVNAVVAPPDVKIQKWSAEEREVQVTSHVPGQVVLRLLNYPSWQVEINGTPVTPQGLSFGQIVVQVGAGQSRVRVRFSRTFDRRAGDSLSVACLVALLVIFLKGRMEAKRLAERNRFAGQNAGLHYAETLEGVPVARSRTEPSGATLPQIFRF